MQLKKIIFTNEPQKCGNLKSKCKIYLGFRFLCNTDKHLNIIL